MLKITIEGSIASGKSRLTSEILKLLHGHVVTTQEAGKDTETLTPAKGHQKLTGVSEYIIINEVQTND